MPMKRAAHFTHLEEARKLRRQAKLFIRKIVPIGIALSKHIVKTVKMSKARPRPSTKVWRKHIQMGNQLQKAAESFRKEANLLVRKRAKLPLKVRKQFDL
jgi:hypothetical protein